jgi:Cellulase (glycosyl hydrolase family 5)
VSASLDWHSGLLTRRQVVKGGVLALAAAGAADFAVRRRLPRTAAPGRVAPARCVTLGANGVINPGSSQDYRSCRAFLRETGTRWVRIWADWPSLQPERDRAPDGGSGAWRLAELGRQIDAANADGLKVILTSYRFPRWANGSSDNFKLPADFRTSSAWAGWIEFLLHRYRTAIAGLELVNEPNSQVWPVRSAHREVAQMFQTAQSIASAQGKPPLLIGPGTSDTTRGSRSAVAYDEFTRLLLDELDRIGFEPGPGFAWAHHNYTDVEHDRDTGAQTTRRLLTGRWAGWPHADAAYPVILIPEGGARLNKISELYGVSDPRTLQARLVRRNWERMARHNWTAMLGQYLFYSDPNFDCGLCDVDGTKRPAYAAWAALSHRAA